MPLASLRWFVAVLALAMLGACATNAPREKPVLGKIALIPATEPATLTLANESGVIFLVPISSVAFAADSKEKARKFNEAMARRAA